MCRGSSSLLLFTYVLKTLHTLCVTYAEIAQLVEHNLAKVRVASSSLVFRSLFERMLEWWNGRHEGLKILWPLRLCGFKSRSEYPHRLLIPAINSLFLFRFVSVLRLTQISQIPQVLLLRVLNLTEAGGNWSVRVL